MEEKRDKRQVNIQKGIGNPVHRRHQGTLKVAGQLSIRPPDVETDASIISARGTNPDLHLPPTRLKCEELNSVR